jgi:uncharacterized membrane protein YhhN
MFPVVGSGASIWLSLLLVIWATLLVGSVIRGWQAPETRQLVATRLRLASSATLVIAAWSWWLVAHSIPGVTTFALLLALGMTCGFLGDLLLHDVPPLKQGFLLGMAAFALGHIFYIAAILQLTPRFQWAIEGAALLLGLAGWYLVVFRGADAGVPRWAALPYALLLATTAGVAVGLAAQEPVFVPLAIGALLFLGSDLLVAGERFGGLRFPHLGDAIWLSYGPAQALIVYAVNSALVAAGTR